jgi:hypothetical protein
MTRILSYFPDDQSRQVVRELLIQVGFGLAIMIGVFATGLQTGPQVGAAAVRVFTFYSLIDLCRAYCRRERMGSPSFNHWDQAAACNLVAIGIDLIIKWPV